MLQIANITINQFCFFKKEGIDFCFNGLVTTESRISTNSKPIPFHKGRWYEGQIQTLRRHLSY